MYDNLLTKNNNYFCRFHSFKRTNHSACPAPPNESRFSFNTEKRKPVHKNAAEGGYVTALAPSPPCTCRALIPRGCPKALKPPTTPLRSSFRSSSSTAENQRREEMESWPRSVGDSWIDSRLVARDSEPVSNALGSQATRTNWVSFHPFYLFPREQLDSPWVCGANRSPSPSLANRITCMRKF